MTSDSTRTASIVRTLCTAEGRDVVFRFGDPISAPVEKYDGRSYRSDTLPKATLHATIQRADIEHLEGVLVCLAKIDVCELERVGIDPAVVYTEPTDGLSEHCIVDVRASREWVETESELSRKEGERAVEAGREDDVLPPWDGLPTVVVDVERTEECLERAYHSDFDLQYSPPTHEIGDVIDVRIT
ncbi:hypothetical protein [Natronococcus occultus]|uniref:Uncharacterized protein n=1 Tax=Natronococcus occultus SP4 TaxID=694430 RepID=L0JWZ7_9EURY|nr:hypothetical protein [Natronococcus occultus]AGB37572.1 hypothetical protein Natoc_1773 [Natronococcus occultus SP4]